eukprot:1175692-Prorocentrum_minimum.AAC.3
MFIFDCFVDGLFMIDIGLNFNTGYYDEVRRSNQPPTVCHPTPLPSILTLSPFTPTPFTVHNNPPYRPHSSPYRPY